MSRAEEDVFRVCVCVFGAQYTTFYSVRRTVLCVSCMHKHKHQALHARQVNNKT